jgi:Amidohydrolase
MREPAVVDVHQHLWPEPLLDTLRARRETPRLRGWTLETAGEPPYDVDPAGHDPAKRTAADKDAGIDVAVVSLSSPLGIEWLDHEGAAPLLDAWHAGALALGERHRVWAGASVRDPDPAALAGALDLGCVGLQVPADAMTTPRRLEHLAPLLAVCEQRDVPVLVHPGPAGTEPELPAWWAAVVDYTGQMAAAWWSWHVAGRRLLPTLRVCFAAGAGLAPVHRERMVARGGRFGTVDRGVFVDTSSYGTQGLDALVRVLGIDALVLGSDRPYAEPTDPGLGEAATRAIRRTNPQRLLSGELS